ncbi:MAG TPA: protein nirF, partial [Bryobacterales bacterium]|nr:protein nirF [Bryobacterales bacterium]
MKRRDLLRTVALLPAAAVLSPASAPARDRDCPGTGDLGVIIERATGSVLIVNTSRQEILGRVEGLGDLSHASVVFSRDEKYAYVFGRDGGLSRIDLLDRRLDHRIIQGGNSIGGAISDDGRLIAVSNYKPGGVKVFDSATLQT